MNIHSKFVLLEFADFNTVARGRFGNAKILMKDPEKLDQRPLEMPTAVTENMMNSAGRASVSKLCSDFYIEHWYNPLSNAGKFPTRVFLKLAEKEMFRDARQLCCQALEKLSAQNLKIYVGSEHEFACYETEKTRKKFDSLNMHAIFNSATVNHLGFYILNEILPELENLGVEIVNFEKEYESVQYEVALMHQAGVRSADSSFYLRQVLKEKFPENVTFLTKCTEQGLTNSCHFNYSLWTCEGQDRPEKNITENIEGNLDSRNLKFLHGILTHLPAILCIFSPTILCFNRLHTPCNWAPDLKTEANPTGCVGLTFTDKASAIFIKISVLILNLGRGRG